MAIAFSTLGESDGVTNNTTAVTVIAAPGSSVSRVFRTLLVFNADTANATIVVQINNNGTKRVFAKVLLVPNQTLQYGEGDFFIALDSTLKSVEILLGGAITTNQLVFVSSWADYA